MSIDSNLRAHFNFDSAQFSSDDKTTQVSVNVKIEGNGVEAQDYNLMVVYNEKLIREKYSLGSETPISNAIKRIIEDIKPQEIMQMASKGAHGVGNELISIKAITKVDVKELKNLEETQKEFLHGIIQKFVTGKEAEDITTSGQIAQEVQKKASEVTESPIKGLQTSQVQYLKKLQDQAVKLERSFKGLTLDGRYKGSEEFTALRRELAMHVFNDAVRPQIEELMKKHGVKGSIDELLCIYGFNRLFTRDRASAGTDVDFMLVLNTDNKEIISEIRQLIKQTKKELNKIGIDMETSDYLIIDLPTYQSKLSSIRSSLFTLANMFNPLKGKDNVALITGSSAMLHDKIFSFTNEQLADHYATLLAKAGSIQESEKESFKARLLSRLEKNDQDFRSHVIDNLQKMAASELYIGKKPYSNKQTIQTIVSSPETAEKRKTRSIPFSTKFCINRIADVIHSTTLKPPMSKEQFHDLETLGLFLCNTVCFLEAKEKAPVTLLESYSEITLDQMKQMDVNERVIASYFLKSFGIDVPPFDEKFAEKLYDGLWQLADQLYAQTKTLEDSIYMEAKNLVTS